MVNEEFFEFSAFAIGLNPKGNAMCSKPHFTLWNILEEDGDWDEDGDWGDPEVVCLNIEGLEVFKKIIDLFSEMLELE